MRRRRPVVRIGTINLSHAAAVHHPDQLLADLTAFLEVHDFVGMQEAGAARHVVEAAAAAAGGTVWFGTGEDGQDSTPVYVGPRCDSVSFEVFPLTAGGRYVGPGAGPDHAKAKWVMVALFELAGTAYAIGNMHATPTQGKPLRALAARIQTRRAAKALRRFKDRLQALVGDLNNVPGSKPLQPLWRLARLRSTQRLLGEIGTEGKRPIDDVRVCRQLRPLAHREVHTVSDHDAYSVAVTPKGHR